MSDDALRELILLAPIFAPGVVNLGCGPESLMRKVPDLLSYSDEELQTELEYMTSEGLVEKWHKDNSRNVFRSTALGRGARELLTRELRQRAVCLCSPAEHNLEDLVLGLAASSDVCEHGHTYPLSEIELADYLFDCRSEDHPVSWTPRNAP